MEKEPEKEEEMSKELKDNLRDIVHIVNNFIVVGQGISGNFQKGYRLDYGSEKQL